MARKLHLASSELGPELRSKAASVRSRLLRWFTTNGRSFRWRQDTSAYVVLISEVLLKKTTAPVVDRFLPKFFEKYPDVSTLSRARVRDLRRMLQPLGLSQQRASQLRSLATAVVDSPGGSIPRSQAGLLSLPGVGPYTANSVLCVAFAQPAPVVDTNVARIVLRVFGVTATRYEPRRCPLVWEIARTLSGTRAAPARRTNWALLDLGASVCLANEPKCAQCPLGMQCTFAQTREKLGRR